MTTITKHESYVREMRANLFASDVMPLGDRFGDTPVFAADSIIILSNGTCVAVILHNGSPLQGLGFGLSPDDARLYAATLIESANSIDGGKGVQ